MEVDNDCMVVLGFRDGKEEGIECPFIPLIVHVDALQQTATVELDKETHIHLVKEASKNNAKTKTKK